MLINARRLAFALLALSFSFSNPTIQAGEIFGLGDLSGGDFFSKPVAMTSDGSIVIGTSESSDGTKHFRWTESTGMTELSIPIPAPYTDIDISAVSDDGSTYAGTFRRLAPENPNALYKVEGFRWTTSGDLDLFGHLPNSYNRSDRVVGISRDGSVVVGGANNELGLTEPFYWTEQGGLQSVIDDTVADFRSSQTFAVSGDGSTIVGQFNYESVSGTRAFRWSSESGFSEVDQSARRAQAVNNDGSLIVGRRHGNGGIFLWDEDTGVELLERSDNFFGRISGSELARAVSDDGSRIVGNGDNYNGLENIAAIWEGDEGGLSLEYVLELNGVDLTGWSELSEASHISADGRYILGYGIHNGNTEAFMVDFPTTAIVPEPSSIVLGGFGFVVFCLIVQRRRKHIA